MSMAVSSLPTPTTFMHDVFLSFRGEDTRHTFTDHLHHALIGAGLRTFRDNDEINRGQEIKPEIETAIIGSRASIVVLSENYADSRWCMDELCLILEQRRKLDHYVLPVFYHVGPSDVRSQRRSFAVDGSIWTAVANWTGFSNCLACLGSKWTDEDVRRWNAALTEVANLSGLKLSRSRSEANFIAKVVETVQCKLDLKQLSTPTHLVAMESRVQVVNLWLKDEQYNAIAFCGMGGSGKTTLAQYIYNLKKLDFQTSSFVEEIGKQHDGLLALQKQLLKDVLGGKKIRISSVAEGSRKIEEVLQMRRVLIVLDDIDKHEQLSALLGTKAFPTQSKIIITTRLLDIDEWFGSISCSCQIQRIKLLDDHESLELLCLYAFRSRTPMKGFKDLALQLAGYCEGNPLALKVLGSSLVVSDEESCRRNEMIKIWESRMKSLNSLKGDLDCNIQGVLQKSFDSLPLRSDKELFLYIACFFVGEYVKPVETILEDELCAKFGIRTLIHKCLLTISADRKLMMHQLIQEMGRRIVCEESNNPAKRSRVWHDVESYHVLRKGDGSDTIEGLALDMRKVEQGMGLETIALKTSSLANMDKLKLLQLKYVKLTGSYENFPELRWLCWHGCPLNTMPYGLFMNSLVVIDMSYGQMEKFEAPTVLNSVKYLFLKGCDKLVSICNLWRLPKLECLILWNCSSLTHLCKSVGDLESLAKLYLTGCTKLWKYGNQTMMLPEQPLTSLPQSLMLLELSNCSLEFNSDVYVAFHAQSSFDLYMGINPMDYVPKNIDLKMLRVRVLSLYSCPNLRSLPCIPSTLEILHIDWCTSLERVTFQSGRFTLREIGYECCFKLCEIQGLFKLVPVAKLDEAGLGHMKWIKAYQDHKVDLVGDDITKGKIWCLQMLYEYGIKSTYLQGIKCEGMPTYEYTSADNFLSFLVPSHFHYETNKIQGLNVCCVYRSLKSEAKDMCVLLVKISNRTKSLTWVYNPVVYGKPIVDEDVVWLSYWPIGNILDAGDEVSVAIYSPQETLIVNGCGASIVYMDSEVEKEENRDNNLMKEQEVIGGDLSEFEVTTGAYYLCRCDLFGSKTLYWLKYLFDDNVRYPDLRGWRKTHNLKEHLYLREFANTFLRTIELGIHFDSEYDIEKMETAISSLVGVESVSTHKETGKLTVTGYVDPVEVATCVREFDNMVEILSAKSTID